MIDRKPVFARCSLFVPNLAHIDAFNVGEPTEVTNVNVVIDLDDGRRLFEWDEAIGRIKHPKGVSLKTDWRFDRRIIIHATFPTSPATPGLVARAVSKIADCLMKQPPTP